MGILNSSSIYIRLRNRNAFKYCLLIAFLLIQFKTKGQADNETALPASREIPETGPDDKIIRHTGYSLLYNEPHEQATWVSYTLTTVETIKLFDRTNDFKPDQAVSTKTATDNDYAGSGYDRGHLAPAFDMGWSAIAMKESFYFSNMSPQQPSFNRGIWKKLEELSRDWAIEK